MGGFDSHALPPSTLRLSPAAVVMPFVSWSLVVRRIVTGAAVSLVVLGVDAGAQRLDSARVEVLGVLPEYRTLPPSP